MLTFQNQHRTRSAKDNSEREPRLTKKDRRIVKHIVSKKPSNYKGTSESMFLVCQKVCLAFGQECVKKRVLVFEQELFLLFSENG